LLRRRVKPEFVGMFNFHSGILQEIPKSCNNYAIPPVTEVTGFLARIL
jgi:hypothetical protein